MANNPTLGFLLHDVARLLRKRFEQRARELGLTRSQWQTLANLNRCEGLHQSKLAEVLEIEPITLVRILDRLEERKLIERRAHPTDRRVRLLFLRDAARPLLDRMQGFGDATRAEALTGLSETDRDQLMRMLSTMKANLVEACGRPIEDDEEKDAVNG